MQKLNLNDLRIFVQAVDSGSFAAAGRIAGTPKSTISKRVAELERQLGVRLIHRTSRSFRLTDIGQEFYEHAKSCVVEAEAAQAIVQHRLAEPSGTVQITASVPVAQHQLADRLPALLDAYPKIDLQLHVSDRFVDLIYEGFDIAVRSHVAPLPDSDLLQRRMSVERIILVAAPDYLERRSAPQTPQELSGHVGINSRPGAKPWRLTSIGGEEIDVGPRSRLCVDEAGMLLHAAKAGLGIACLPEKVARASLAADELRHVLPGWSEGTITTTLLTPHKRGVLPAVRAVIDFLVQVHS